MIELIVFSENPNLGFKTDSSTVVPVGKKHRMNDSFARNVNCRLPKSSKKVSILRICSFSFWLLSLKRII